MDAAVGVGVAAVPAAEGTLALQANASPSARLVNAGGTLSAGRHTVPSASTA